MTWQRVMFWGVISCWTFPFLSLLNVKWLTMVRPEHTASPALIWKHSTRTQYNTMKWHWQRALKCIWILYFTILKAGFHTAWNIQHLILFVKSTFPFQGNGILYSSLYHCIDTSCHSMYIIYSGFSSPSLTNQVGSKVPFLCFASDLFYSGNLNLKFGKQFVLICVKSTL